MNNANDNKPNDFLKIDQKRLRELDKKRDKERSPWMDVIENSENWEKLDIRVKQKSGQFKRLRQKLKQKIKQPKN